MAPARPNVDWSDEVNDLAAASTKGTTTKIEAAYAIKWGEKVEITDNFIAQICPADLANHVCGFDYVMPNGCDHNCEMLRLCQVYVAHFGYDCPNTDDDNLKCPYVHGVPVSCSNVNRQFTLHNEKKGLVYSLGSSWEPTAAEIRREEKNKKKGKAAKDRFTCSIKVADDCQRGHDHQLARLASYALLQKHQHAGRIVSGLETETFNEKTAREVELLGTQSKNSNCGKTTPLPADANATLVVQSMAYSTTEENLKAAFEKYGDVKRVNVLMKDDGTSKGTGFVDFNDVAHAVAAHDEMQGAKLDGRTIRVKFKGDQGKSQGGGGGGLRACYTCNQEGHMSRDCPTKDSNQDGTSNGYDKNQVQTFGGGWGDAGGEPAGGDEWANAGGTTVQELTTNCNTADNNTAQEASSW